MTQSAVVSSQNSVESTQDHGSSRYPLKPESLSQESRQALETILARRGTVPPIYRTLISSPSTALKVEELSSMLWCGNLSKGTLEAVFLVVAKKFDCAEQWRRHEPKALAAGVSSECIQAIQRGLSPRGSPSVRFACQIAKRLLGGRRVGAQLWESAARELGAAGLADLVAFLGIASMVAMAINIQEEP